MLLFTEAGAAASDEFVPYLRPTNGSSAVRLGKGGAIALSPDGKWAAVVDLVPERLSLLPTGAGNARVMNKGSIEQYDFAGWWSGDGKSIGLFADASHFRAVCDGRLQVDLFFAVRRPDKSRKNARSGNVFPRGEIHMNL
jgi:hypothetical protein